MKNFSTIIDSYKDDMIKMLCELVSFPSVKADPAGTMPFGKAIDDCLRYTLGRAEEFGLKAEYIDGYAGHADIGSGEKTMGILVHLDVVPAGGGWDTDPFTATIKDGTIFGRGANDNKVASVATLFAIKACREMGVDFKKKVRVIFGCDEESGWADIDYYKTKHKMPDFGYSPDGAFPVVNAEKGVVHLELMIPLGGDDKKILSLTGGERANVVLEKTEALVDGSIAPSTESNIIAEKKGGATLITATGLAAHGSRPELGVNAGVMLMKVLRDSGLSGNVINLVCDCIGGKTDGAGFGVNFKDEPSGELTLNLGILEKQGDSVRAVLDIRCPVTYDCIDVSRIITDKAAKYGATVRKIHEHRPIYLPEDHPLIKTLLEQYTKVTGLPGYVISMGGGTYARTMDNAVAFGCDFPDADDDHGIHKQNEYVSINDMMRACKVFANVIAAVQDIDIPT